MSVIMSPMKKIKKIAVVFGTRPEVTKLAPLIFALRAKKFQTILISTGQHDELFVETMQAFKLKANYNLKIMQHGQTLATILTRAVSGLDEIYSGINPDLTIVLGDASSTLAGAIVSFYHKIPVAHVEAGMRSSRFYEPFPEEANRQLIACLTNFFFPATEAAKQNLVREGYPHERIFMVGTTEIDAIQWILQNTSETSPTKIIPRLNLKRNLIVITTHRRESWGKPLENVFTEVRILALRYQDYQFVHSAHPNPVVYETARRIFKTLPNVLVLPHIPFVPFVHLLSKATLIMTDSGGIQVDAAALKKPVLILRNVTEWREIIDAGLGQLVGTDKKRIIHAFEQFVQKTWPKKNACKKEVYPIGAARNVADILFDQFRS